MRRTLHGDLTRQSSSEKHNRHPRRYIFIEKWPRNLAANAHRIPKNKLARHMPGAGRSPNIPDIPVMSLALNSVNSIICLQGFLAFMVEQRANNKAINSVTMMEWVKMAEPHWLQAYMARASSPEKAYMSMRRLLRRTAKTVGFRWRRARPAPKLNPAQLAAEKARFSAEFWADHADREDANMFNIDETGVLLDTPPHYAFAPVGSSTHVEGDEKKSARITAVLGARRDGTILFLDSDTQA